MTKAQKSKALVIRAAELFIDDMARADLGQVDWQTVRQSAFELEGTVRLMRMYSKVRDAAEKTRAPGVVSDWSMENKEKP